MSYKDPEKQREAERKWYYKNRDVVQNRNRLEYRKRKAWFKKYKESNPCKDCGNYFPYYVMDFDHLRDKKFLVSRLRTCGWDKLMEEVKKCDLVCSNCHRIRTHSRSITD